MIFSFCQGEFLARRYLYPQLISGIRGVPDGVTAGSRRHLFQYRQLLHKNCTVRRPVRGIKLSVAANRGDDIGDGTVVARISREMVFVKERSQGGRASTIDQNKTFEALVEDLVARLGQDIRTVCEDPVE